MTREAFLCNKNRYPYPDIFYKSKMVMDLFRVGLYTGELIFGVLRYMVNGPTNKQQTDLKLLKVSSNRGSITRNNVCLTYRSRILGEVKSDISFYPARQVISGEAEGESDILGETDKN